MFSTLNAVLDLNLDHAADLKNTTLLRVIPTPRHKFWHLEWSFGMIYYDMTYVYIYILKRIYIYICIYKYIFCHSIWNSTSHSIRHSIWHLFWHIFCHSTYSTWYIFWHSIWHIIWHSIWHPIWLGYGARSLRSSSVHCASGLAIQVREYPLRSGARNYVRQCPLRSGGGGWRGEEEGGRKKQVSSLIKSSNHHLQSESAESWQLLYYQSEVAVLSWHIHPSPRWERITNTHKDI